MVRTEPLGVRVTPEIKARLLKIAKAEDRSMASLIERVLLNWLAAQPAPPPKKKV